jgi:hypothetical protein
MPRDLESLKQESLADIQSFDLPNYQGSTMDSDGSSNIPAGEAEMDREDEDNLVQAISNSHGPSQRDQLHPYTQTLTLNDVDSCTLLEEAAFPPNERATNEKVSTVCKSTLFYM